MAGPNTLVDDIFAYTYDGLYLGQQIITTTHWRVIVAPPSPADLTQTYRGMLDQFSTLGDLDAIFMDIFSSGVHDMKRTIQKIHPQRCVSLTEFCTPSTGTRAPAAQNNPANVAASLTFRTLEASPSGKGNKHILLTNPVDCSDGLVGSAVADKIQAWGTSACLERTCSAPAAGLSFSPIIYHRPDPGLSEKVETSVLHPTSRILRRRTVGLGT